MATTHDLPNVSADLVWEIARNNNAYLVKRKQAGGVQFSRDPLNLTNQHSRKHAGFVNNEAVGVQGNNKGHVRLTTKKGDPSHPRQNHQVKNFGQRKSNRNVYKAVGSTAAADNYRPDLHSAAVSRASALRRSTRTKEPKTIPKRVRTKKPHH